MHSISKETIFSIFILFGLSLFVFTSGLSILGLEYRDDEIFYFQSTQEMLSSGNFLSPTYFGENRFQKPILFYWFILLFYKIFGVNWLAARMVAAVFGGLTVALTWLMAREFFSRRIAFLSAFILITIPLFFRHAKNAVPDMPFNFFIVLAFYFLLKLIRSAENERSRFSLLFFLSCAVGFMIKGFAAVIVPLFILFFYVFRYKKYYFLKQIKWAKGFILMGIIVLPWFLYMIQVHGLSYLEYMFNEETKYRIIGAGGNFLFEKAGNFVNHLFFYAEAFFSYFAPWSIFLFLLLPWLWHKHKQWGRNGQEIFNFFWIWPLGVVIFFSLMYFAINHYLLILSTPFAILIGYFLLEEFPATAMGKFLNGSRKFLFYFILGVVYLGSLIVFPLIGTPKIWLGIFMAGYPIFCFWMFKRMGPHWAPFFLSLFLVFILTKSSLLAQAGLTSHATFQKFVRIIQQGIDEDTLIAVASHDLHEKELQVFFSQEIKKLGCSYDPETQEGLERLFSSPQEAYCFILEKDYQKFIKNRYEGRLDVLQEEYIVRKRVSLDKNFFVAFLTLNQATIKRYLMEKILLLRKHDNV